MSRIISKSLTKPIPKWASSIALISSLVCGFSAQADTFIVKFKHQLNARNLSAIDAESDEPVITFQGKAVEQSYNKLSNNAVIQIDVPQSESHLKRQLTEASAIGGDKSIRVDGNHLNNQMAVIEQLRAENNNNIDYIVPADFPFMLSDMGPDRPTPGLANYNPDKQWNMIGPYGLHMDKAWELLQNKPLAEITVAVVDSGFAKNAPLEIKKQVVGGGQFFGDEINNQIQLGFKRDYTDGGTKTGYHGTHVAGIIANNGSVNPNTQQANAGVNPLAKILVVKALSDMGTGSDAAIIPAIEWAAGVSPQNLTLTNFKGELPPENKTPARVINLSLGMSRDAIYPPITDQVWNQYRTEICAQYRDVANHVSQMGTVLVFAAGNDNKAIANDLPSSCENMPMLVVQASGPTGHLSYYSTHGDVPGTTVVTAPGGDAHLGQTIWSTINGGYGSMQGTSQATPHVSGLTSLVFATNPKLTAQEAIEEIKRSQVDVEKTQRFRSLATCDADTEDEYDPQGNEYHLGLVSAPKAISCLNQ